MRNTFVLPAASNSFVLGLTPLHWALRPFSRLGAGKLLLTLRHEAGLAVHPCYVKRLGTVITCLAQCSVG